MNLPNERRMFPRYDWDRVRRADDARRVYHPARSVHGLRTKTLSYTPLNMEKR